jgi:2-(1,2-epoxy-1,2-dihydrophenyl)acetyl-CoA isomerase
MQAQPVQHRVEVEGAVATITLDRPAAYNALTADLIESLHVSFSRLDRDPDVRAIVLTGAGKGFSAGQALDDRRSIDDRDPGAIGRAVRERYNPLLTALLESSTPTVAAINGVVAGAGLGLALACDFRIAAADATFTTAFAKLGLVPDCGVSFLLPRIVGYGRALELCLLAERFDAQRAEALGMLTQVVPPGAAFAAAHALATQLASGPGTLGLTKRLLARNGLGDVAAALELEAQTQTRAGATEDFAEGLRAFAEKRAPVFH